VKEPTLFAHLTEASGDFYRTAAQSAPRRRFASNRLNRKSDGSPRKSIWLLPPRLWTPQVSA